VKAKASPSHHPYIPENPGNHAGYVWFATDCLLYRLARKHICAALNYSCKPYI